MRHIVRHVFLLGARVAFATGLIAALPTAGEHAGIGVRPRSDVPLPSATIGFAVDDIDVGPAELAALDGVAGRASSDLGIRVVVLGFANERKSLRDNLDLADRRARSVAEHLLERGVLQWQLVVAAREGLEDDPQGRRCEVEIVERRANTHAHGVDDT